MCSAKHLLANVNYIRDTVLTWPLNVQFGRERTGKGLQKNVEMLKDEEDIKCSHFGKIVCSVVTYL